MENKGAGIAVVIGLGINGLGVSRALGRKGVAVHGFFNDFENEIGRVSKYVKSHFFQEEEDLLPKLIEFAKEQKEKPVLFSSSDRFLEFIVENNEPLKNYYLFNAVQGELNEIFTNKLKVADLLESANIMYPKIYKKKTDSGEGEVVNDILEQLNLPVIVKPAVSWDLKAVDGNKNLIFEEKENFIVYLEEKKDLLDSVVIQELIPHEDSDVYYSTGYYNTNNKLKGIFSARKLRQYLPKYGITCFAVSKPLDDVIELTKNFLETVNFVGLFDIEFIYDKRDGIYKFIELNPRTHLANSHSEFCGINLPWLAFNDLVGNDLNANLNQKNNVYWIYFEMDMGSCYRKLKKKEITFSKWFLSLFKARSFALWAKDDPIPFIKNFFNF